MGWKVPGRRREDAAGSAGAVPAERFPEGAGGGLAFGERGALSLEIGHAQMEEATRGGLAVPLGRGFPWVVRYGDAWWVEYEDGWLRIIDDQVAAEFDNVAARLAEASGGLADSQET